MYQNVKRVSQVSNSDFKNLYKNNIREVIEDRLTAEKITGDIDN
jgi:hypothetical protein